MSGRVDRSSREAHERESRLEQASYGNRGPSAYGRHLPTSAEGRQKRQMALAELTDEQIEAYESVPMATPTLQKCFEALDARGTGQINVGDFCRGLQVFGAPFSIDEVEAFKKLVDRSSLEDTFRYEDVLELRASTLKDNKQEEGVPPVPPDQMESKRRLLTRKKKEQAQSNQDSAAVLAQLQSTDSAEVRGPSRQSLTKEQIAEFREAFCIFDVDGNGTVTTSELGEVMAGLGQKMSEAELQLMIDEVDADHTGTMNFEEFLDLMAIRLAGIDSEAELRDAFKTFDQDGNGFIEAEELMRVVTTMGETLQIEEAQAMLREVDVDGNGMIDYEEFTKVMLG